MLTNPRDLCPCISVSHLLAMHLSLLVSVLNVKVLVGAFNQEKACEIFVSSSTGHLAPSLTEIIKKNSSQETKYPGADNWSKQRRVYKI